MREIECEQGKCQRCQESAVHLRSNRRLCAVHYRLEQMAERAKARGLRIPTSEEFASLLASVIEDGMKCPHCRKEMAWLAGDDYKAVVSLQHDRSGRIRLLCYSCNTRHHYFPGDTFYDYPADWKFCPKCRQAKPLEQFYRKPNARCLARSYCRGCKAIIAKQEWAAKKGTRSCA